MKKIALLLIMIASVADFKFAAKLGNLEGVEQPQMIQVWDDNLYVIQQATIFVYSLKDLSLIRKFGKAGEGPGELKLMTNSPNCITVFSDYIFVDTLDKILFFSKKGKFIREQRKTTRMFRILPMKKNFLVKKKPFLGKDKKRYVAVTLCNEKMEDIKELYRQEFSQKGRPQDIYLIPDSINYWVYDDKIFIEESPKGFFIEVFDSEGKRVYQINKEYKKIKVTEEHKTLAINSFKEERHIKALGGWENFKKTSNFIYPDTLPPIQNILVDNNKIYIQTFNHQGNKEEYIIMDLKGNNPKHVFLPLVKKVPFISQLLGKGLKYYAINNNRFIYLIENEDEETWEIHMIKIE